MAPRNPTGWRLARFRQQPDKSGIVKSSALNWIGYAVLSAVAQPAFAIGPQSINQNILSTYAGNQAANPAAVLPINEPPPVRAKFYLRTSDTVVAGEPVNVEIVRQQSDGQPHDFRLQFQPRGVVLDPPLTVTIDAAQDNWKGAIATIRALPNDRPVRLAVFLLPGDTAPDIGVPRMAEVMITAPPKPVAYSVRPPNTAMARGDEIRFAITRQNGVGQTRIPYNVTQGKTLVSTGELEFSEDLPSRNVDVENYDRCGEPLNLKLLGVGAEVSAVAAFAADQPAECISETGSSGIPEWWPWMLALLALLALPLGLFGKRRLWPNKDAVDPGPKDRLKSKATRPVHIGANFRIQSGLPSFPAGQPNLRIPRIRCDMRITPGKSACPHPMPMRERMDV